MARSEILALVFALLLGSGVFVWHTHDERVKSALRTTPEALLVASREIYDYTPSTDGTVSYTYYTKPLPEKLYDNEVVEKRTDKMVVRFIRQIDKDHREMQAIFYTAPIHARDSRGVWRSLAHATTTIEAWETRPLSLRESALAFIMPIARAFGPTGGAGYINSFAVHPTTCGGAATLARSATIGTASALGSGVVGLQMNDYVGPGCDADLYRTWMPFDTSYIPNTFPITSASLSINITSSVDNYANGRAFYLATTTQLTHTTLSTDDFEQIRLGPAKKINTSATDHIISHGYAGPHTYDIDTPNLNSIKRSGEASSCSATAGITCLGIAMGVENLGTSDGDSPISIIFFNVGTVSLSTNYVESNFAFWQFQDF